MALEKLGKIDPAIHLFVTAKIWGGFHQPFNPFVLLWFLFCTCAVDLLFSISVIFFFFVMRWYLVAQFFLNKYL